MNATDKLMAWAQIGLSVLLFVATFIASCYYFWMIHTGIALPADSIRSLESLLDKMWTACGIVVFFWFQRQRTAGIPDGTSMVTQSHTAPDGSKTVIVSPASTTPLTPTGATHAPLLSSVSIARVPDPRMPAGAG